MISIPVGGGTPASPGRSPASRLILLMRSTSLSICAHAWSRVLLALLHPVDRVADGGLDVTGARALVLRLQALSAAVGEDLADRRVVEERVV